LRSAQRTLQIAQTDAAGYWEGIASHHMSLAAQTRPVLVFAYGNPSRGDDALGPLLIERLEERQRAGALTRVDLLTDFQLQVEHALDLRGRERVIFAEAAASGPEPPRACIHRPVADCTTVSSAPALPTARTRNGRISAGTRTSCPV
jgi:hypothetical protein